jgi:hypothetical protein
MLSKWQIWDFFSSFDRAHLERYQGVMILNTFDPICLKLVKDFLFKGIGNRIVRHKVASEVSKNWIEEEFQTLSLFGDSDNFFIHQAQDLSSDLIESFSKLELQNRFVLLSFETENATWKKLLKENKLDFLQLESPRFWELYKLLDFVCTYLRLPLSYEAKTWILDSLENNLGAFYNACSLLKLNHPDAKEVSVNQVKELLTLEKLDQFALAGLFCRKKNADFFEKLVALEGDFEKMRGFFLFMQGHLIKLADTSYFANKPRLNQYEKDLQNASRLWKSSEVLREVARMNHWELLCKKKDARLWHELRLAYLHALSPRPV